MSSGSRIAAVALLGAGGVALVGLLLFASAACPRELPGQPCPDAGRNQAIVISLAAGAAGLVAIPLAFLAEFARRRGIVYGGAWLRAARRGLLLAAVVAALGGLRLADALSVPGAIFILLLAIMVEWFSRRLLDAP